MFLLTASSMNSLSIFFFFFFFFFSEEDKKKKIWVFRQILPFYKQGS